MGKWKRQKSGVITYIDSDGNMAWLEGTRPEVVEEANRELGMVLIRVLELSTDRRKSG